MAPTRLRLEEQTEAHALLAKAANHPDWQIASHALDELMRRLLVLHRLLGGRGALGPARRPQKLTPVSFADIEQGGTPLPGSAA